MRAAFTIWEAEFAIYHEQDGDYIDPAIYAGGCAEKIEVSRKYERIPIRRPGSKFAQQYPHDESHEVHIQNVWTWDDGMMPDWGRWERYVLVVRWFDRDTGAWAKLTWYGVTLPEDKLDGVDGIMQDLPLAAEQRTTILSGLNSPPDLEPQPLVYEVWYVASSERRKLYVYDGVSSFVVVDPTLLSGRASITAVGDALQFSIASTLAMTASPSSLSVAEILGIQTFVDEFPKLEFWSGKRRLASLGYDGVLAVPDIFEASAPLGNPGGMTIRLNGQWLFTLGRNGMTAPELVET